MGLVGSISAIQETKLQEFIAKPYVNTKYREQELYMDKFFWDIHYVLSEYFKEEERLQNQNLIFGAQKITDMNKGAEVHYAYSDIPETKQLSEVINRYSKEAFEIALHKALGDPRSMITNYHGDKMFEKATLLLFEQLQALYAQAAKKEWCMIYVFG